MLAYLLSLLAQLLAPAVVAGRTPVDIDLEVFKRRLSRAMRAYPTHYSDEARAFRDPATRTKLVALLEEQWFPTEVELQRVIALMKSQGPGSYHVEAYVDPADPMPEGRAPARLAIVADVAWL